MSGQSASTSSSKKAVGGIASTGLHADTINKLNARGMPYAPFVTNVDHFVGGQEAGVEGVMKKFEEMTAKYRYMEVNLQQKRKGLEVKVPDISKTLDVVRFLEARRCKRLGTKPTTIPKQPKVGGEQESEAEDDDAVSEASDDSGDLMDEVDELDAEDGDEGEESSKSRNPLKTLYELNDTLFAEAEVEEDGNVGLWLGANTMLLYPLNEAVLLLSEKLSVAKRSLRHTKEDLEFLREQITVMEVNFARVHNWDVKRRRDAK
ncbi:hypothetical protein QFC22_000348 [Naganishia vaughanmartiniae]|uniref:Uncharacterized protein n=1 Tax=Naganishia vaughanmartiniae TaxID=1424756 RepID=A0ACC2XP33_9TREE|nr:hypothetical protein QFC22_000348 [Naganishia vaughanmartiniae]